MKRLTYTIIALCITALTAMADNKKQTVTSVTQAIDVKGDVDYVITSSTLPFATSGSVNIADTEHAVVIFSNIKPSEVISKYMSFIYIEGNRARNGINCQVKMYGAGAIVFPYDSNFKPLTVYSEPGFEGTSVNSFGLENTGGFMNTLTASKLNNRIRSFKLKRGYMVTFALGTGGWGYSRCFIADQADLEMSTMPANMDSRISSYRVFHWYNAQKKGLASNGGKAANDALNTSWCYDWAQGNESLLPDHEWVPNHIYEDWPSAATCGGVTGSCHMKTNNEPGNSADDHPQDVATVLANWQNLMRTGMRLCSETSHDGSMNHLKAFIDSIDARGWRCDIIDLHCYWASGFGNLTWYSDNYGNGRPIWISEWIWGASWNHNGAFGSGVSDSQITDQTKGILSTLNSNSRVERYAYWNGESKGHIYENGSLTSLGKYYASMNSGLGYNKANEYIPRVVYSTPTALEITNYNKTKKIATLTWNDNNGDMLDSMIIEYQKPGATRFQQLAKVTLKDKNSGSAMAYTANVTLNDGAGIYNMRVAAYPINSRSARYSNTATVTVSESAGNDIVQYGMIDFANTAAIETDFSNPFDETPAVFMGLMSIHNSSTNMANLVSSVSTRAFTYQPMPWVYSGTQTITAKEQIPFMALKYGNYTFAPSMNIEVGQVKVKSDTVQVTFNQPFAEGTVPVVIAELRPSLKSNPMTIRIWDVTNTGFKAIASYEAGLGKNITIAQNMMYMAATPGVANIGDGIQISVGTGTTPLYGSTNRQEIFRQTNPDGTIDDNADTLQLINPYIFGAAQTFNIKAGVILRRFIDITTIDAEKGTLTYGTRIRRMVDTSGSNSTLKNTQNEADTFGWICISTAADTFEAEDVNQDGTVDTQDVLAVYNYISTAADTSDTAIEDVNGDGTVDTQDVLQIYNYIATN